jgi:hypothetical protein
MVAILAGAAASPDVPGWVQGADAIGMAATGVVAIGMVATGVVAIGMTVTGTAIGVIITVTIMSSSLAVSAFHRGGAGDIQDITATGIRTAITGMAIRTVTVMAMEGMDTVTTATVTAMDMATALAANTALPLDRE